MCVRWERESQSERERVGSETAKSLNCPSFFHVTHKLYLFRNYFSFIFCQRVVCCILQNIESAKKNKTQSHIIWGQINKQHTDCLHFLLSGDSRATRFDTLPLCGKPSPVYSRHTHTHSKHTLWQRAPPFALRQRIKLNDRQAVWAAKAAKSTRERSSQKAFLRESARERETASARAVVAVF